MRTYKSVIKTELLKLFGELFDRCLPAGDSVLIGKGEHFQSRFLQLKDGLLCALIQTKVFGMNKMTRPADRSVPIKKNRLHPCHRIHAPLRTNAIILPDSHSDGSPK